MTDYPIPSRLREIASDLRVLARNRRHKDGRDVSSEIETQATKLNEIITELEQPAAGASAYEMLAAAETANIGVTETLIHMVAATVLAKLIDDEGQGRSDVRFSPADMDAMHQRYEMNATRDGMLTVVSITPRPGAFADAHVVTTGTRPPVTLYADDDPAHSGPARPQAAEHIFDRPLWAVRIDGVLTPCSDRKTAEQSVSWHAINRTQNIVQIENRFCYHPDCPAEHCNLEIVQPEATSDD